MGSTEPRGEVVPLGSLHLPGCLALSQSAGWNQNAADWRLMLEMGRGWGVVLPDATLAASTVILPYGSGFGWVSMVLVLPAHRRKGYATRLLRKAIAELEGRGLTPVLDATPACREVYLQEGFGEAWGFKRFFLQKGFAGEPSAEVRGMRERDWPAILEMDAAAFGGDREMLLRALAMRLPAAALVFEAQGKVEGFLLGREGRESSQLGPLVARNASIAKALLDHGLAQIAAPLYIDVADHAPELAEGFELQRPFTRMVYGKHRAPGDERRVFLVAGPELG